VTLVSCSAVQNSHVLEIAVDTLDRALAAERGGAHRIELCRELLSGGLTPSVESMRLAREQVRLPIFAMIRPRGGDFVYSTAEFAEMQRDVTVAAQMGMDGLVLGIIAVGGRVDIERTRQLVELARPLPVTFHRAFDATADLSKALEDVIQTGAVRILTSGGAASAHAGVGCLTNLVEIASKRIVVMPGGGITAMNVAQLANTTGAREFHAGLSSVSADGEPDERRFEEEVRKLARTLAACAAANIRKNEKDSRRGH
jgi:copper homeostasis protein